MGSLKAGTQKYNGDRVVAKRYVSTSTETTLLPFFVWDYKTYHTMVSKLLSGKKVILFADVTILHRVMML